MFLLDTVPPSPMDVLKYGVFQGDLTTPLLIIGGIILVIISILVIKRR